MDAATVVSYEDLVADYEKNLQTQLRGFKQAHEFLDLWVHDEDPAKSILSIVEAAESGGLSEIGILIGSETLSKVDTQKLLALVGKVGTARLAPQARGTLLTVAL